METPKLSATSLVKAVTYPARSENPKNTIHGIGPKGNVRLKIGGNKKTGSGILFQQQSRSTSDGRRKYRSVVSHVSPTSFPLDEAQIIPCIDENTGKKYCFIGSFVKKSSAPAGTTSSHPVAVSHTESISAPIAAASICIETPIFMPNSGMINELVTAKNVTDISFSPENHPIRLRIKKEKAVPKDLEAQMQRVSAARISGCDIRIKLPIVLVLTGLATATIYRRMNDKTRPPFPKQQPKAENESGVFWLLSEVDNYLGLKNKNSTKS